MGLLDAVVYVARWVTWTARGRREPAPRAPAAPPVLLYFIYLVTEDSTDSVFLVQDQNVEIMGKFRNMFRRYRYL